MKRLLAILLCKILAALKISVAINVMSPNGELIAYEKEIAIAINCWSRQFEDWNYGRYLTAICNEDSNCIECDLKDTCEYS